MKKRNNVINSVIPIISEYGGEVIFVGRDTFLYAQAADNYVFMHQFDGNTIEKKIFRTTLKNLEDRLSSFQFLRCHRSFLINKSKIKSIHRSESGISINLLGIPSPIPVSRNNRKKVYELIRNLKTVYPC